MVGDAQAQGLVDRTAVGAAAVRAVHLLHDGEPKILRDEYALPLIGWTTQQLADVAQEMARLGRQTSAWVSRSRFAEDRLVAARTRGVCQYVILGAGLGLFLALVEQADRRVRRGVREPGTILAGEPRESPGGRW